MTSSKSRRRRRLKTETRSSLWKSIDDRVQLWLIVYHVTDKLWTIWYDKILARFGKNTSWASLGDQQENKLSVIPIQDFGRSLHICNKNKVISSVSHWNLSSWDESSLVVKWHQQRYILCVLIFSTQEWISQVFMFVDVFPCLVMRHILSKTPKWYWNITVMLTN